MHNLRYKIWQWIGPVPNRNPQFNVAVLTRAKRSLTNPFELANELFCTRLGMALNLPIPAGVILDHQGKQYYSSLHVAVAGEGFPDATDEELDEVAKDERLTTGIIVFDSWILNADRHCGNIFYDDTTKQTYIFDHGNAFYWKTGRPNFTGDEDNIGINGHCLQTRVKSLWAFDDWHAQILAIPESFIHDCVDLACRHGVPESDKDFCLDFMLRRREKLKEIFQKEYTSTFPSIEPDLLDPFQHCLYPCENYQI